MSERRLELRQYAIRKREMNIEEVDDLEVLSDINLLFFVGIMEGKQIERIDLKTLFKLRMNGLVVGIGLRTTEPSFSLSNYAKRLIEKANDREWVESVYTRVRRSGVAGSADITRVRELFDQGIQRDDVWDRVKGQMERKAFTAAVARLRDEGYEIPKFERSKVEKVKRVSPEAVMKVEYYHRVMELRKRGLTAKRIAAIIGLSKRTVENWCYGVSQPRGSRSLQISAVTDAEQEILDQIRAEAVA